MKDDEILDLLEEIERPFLKSKDVETRFDVSQNHARRRLDKIMELEKHIVGSSAAVWYPKDWEDCLKTVEPQTDGPQT